MPRILLLTFDHLPNRQLIGDSAALTVVYEQLDAVSAYFENHYLQSPGADSLLAPANVWQTLSEAVRTEDLHLSVDASCASSPSITPRPSPLSATWESVLSDQIPLRISSPAAAADKANLENDGNAPRCLHWVHTCLPTADADAAQRLQCLINALSDGGWTHVLITSLSGSPPPEGGRFSSQCFEGRLRVPLWVLKGSDCRRITALTGSYDLAATLLDLLTSPSDDDSVRGESPAADASTATDEDEDEKTDNDKVEVAAQSHATEPSFSGPESLRPYLAQVGHRPERYLLIDADSQTVIRSSEFLYAAATDPSDRPALYAKPADCWNVNDVSAEYLQLVQDYERLLTQLPQATGSLPTANDK